MTPGLKVEYWPIDRLIPYARNSRTHSDAQVAQVAASIKEFGWANPILVDGQNVVVAGHARLAAAHKLGMAEVPVIVLGHLTEAQRRALVIAENKLAMNAGWDEEMLRTEIEALREEQISLLDLIGFSDEELRAMQVDEPNPAVTSENEDAAPAASATPPCTQRGDLWLLGKHRLLCGDATDIEDLKRVLDGSLADLAWTDPPYGVDYVGKTAKKLTIANDALGGKFYDFLFDAISNILLSCRGAIYVCMSSSELHTLYKAFVDAGGHWSTFVIWAKHHFTLGRSDYQRMYEPILYGWREGASHYWCGDRNQGDVWPIKRPMANVDHPTKKPVELVQKAIENSSQMGAVVLDPFAGSGSTLVACEKTGRQARLIELDPKYCDVIIRHWQGLTGGHAVTVDGRSFTEPAEVAA